MSYHFIYNPVAGNGHSVEVWAVVKSYLEEKHIDYLCHETQHINHAQKIVHDLTSRGEDVTIISVGGDGTLSEVVNGIADFQHTILSFIPCGGGNDFLTATKLPRENTISQIEYILSGQVRSIDYMVINDKYRSINVAGFGLDTEVLKKYYQMKHFNQKFRYKYATLVKTLFFKWHHSEIKIDDSPLFDTTTLLLSVGNGQTIGGGINMCPTAVIDDGYLDFTYIAKFSRWKTIWALHRVLNGKVLTLNFAKSIKCKQVEIKLSNPLFQYDGILVEGEQTLSVKIGEQKINFIG